MGKATAGVLEELAQFFGAQALGGIGVAPIRAQSYQPGGSGGYDPVTDMRLANLVASGLTQKQWARTRQALDELSAADVEVLRLACGDRHDERFPRVAAQLPEALEQGRRIAERWARTAQLEELHRVLRQRGVSGVAAAQRILEEEPRVRVRVGWREVQRAAYVGVREGEIDVGEQATARVDAAVEAYVRARDAVPSMKRAKREREERRCAEYRASLRASREEKERARFEARLRRAAT